MLGTDGEYLAGHLKGKFDSGAREMQKIDNKTFHKKNPFGSIL